MPGCIPRGAPACGIRGKQKPGTPPGAPRVSRRDKGGPRERAETNALQGRRKRETLATTRRPGLAQSARGSRLAADVVVRTGTDDEPSLGVTRDRK